MVLRFPCGAVRWIKLTAGGLLADARAAEPAARRPGQRDAVATRIDARQVGRLPINARNSSRVAVDSRNVPSTDEVIMTEFCFSTPRIIMHKWRASIITPTPLASTDSMTSLRYLLGEALLKLQAARVHVHQPRQLGHAEYPAARYVADVASSEKRQHVVLAKAVDLDVLHDHHAVGFLREHRAVDQPFQVDTASRR